MKKRRRGKEKLKLLREMRELRPSQVGCSWVRSDLVAEIRPHLVSQIIPDSSRYIQIWIALLATVCEAGEFLVRFI